MIAKLLNRKRSYERMMQIDEARDMAVAARVGRPPGLPKNLHISSDSRTRDITDSVLNAQKQS